jgi:hypothetical protein
LQAAGHFQENHLKYVELERLLHLKRKNCAQKLSFDNDDAVHRPDYVIRISMSPKRRTLDDLLQLTKRCGRSQHAETSP